MNYRAHLHVPSAVHVEASVVDHPEYFRVIELPRDAPGEWLARAYLLSVGIDAHDDDIESFEYGCQLDRFIGFGASYGLEEWESGYPGGRRGARLAPFPHEVELAVRHSRTPEIGDAKVSIIEAAGDAARADPAWQAAAPPFRLEAVNHELARRYGVVLPRLDSSALSRPTGGIPERSLIATVLRRLTPVRRLALRAHLEDGGLLGPGSCDDATISAATRALRTLLEVIGPDGVAQDADTGWLPAGVTDRVSSGLGWAADLAPGEVVASLARRAGLVRRLKGRVVATTAGRQLIADPARGFGEVLRTITGTDRRHGYDVPRFEVAVAILAIADGAAQDYGELADFVERADAASGASMDEDLSWYAYDVGASVGRAHVDAALETLVTGFLGLSEPGAFGVITPHIRAVARAALL